MKGELKNMRKLVERACVEQKFGVEDRHLRVLSCLTNHDLTCIKQTGGLASERISELPENEETQCHLISLLTKWFQMFQKLSDRSESDLKRNGFKIKKIDDGMYEMSYDEHFPDQENAG